MALTGESEPRKTTASKVTQTAREASGLIKQFYARVQEAARNGEPIAWCKHGVPEEPLIALGVEGVFPENYSTICAAKQVGLPFMERAESTGYANFACSYARTTLGYASQMEELKAIPPQAPWGGMPRPAMLVGRTSCEPGYQWFHVFNRYFHVPAFAIDDKLGSPQIGVNYEDPEVRKRYCEFHVGQLREFIAFLEKVTGRKMDWDRLSEAVKRHHEARRLWHAVHELRRSVPCPMPSGAMTTCIFPGYFMMGRQEAVDFYQKLYDEVKFRVEHKMGAIPNEKYRLLWGGIAQWHNLGFYNQMENHGAVFVIETNYYRDAFTDEVDFSKPLEAIVRREYELAVLASRRAQGSGGTIYPARAGLIMDLAAKYRLTGVVLHLIVSCRPVSIGWTHTRNVLRERFNLPTLLLDSDICDSRAFSEAQAKVMVDSFVDTMAAMRKN